MDSLQDAIRVIEQDQMDPGVLGRDVVVAAVDEVVRGTAAAYTKQSASYEQAREAAPWKWDEYLTATLLERVRSRIADGSLPLGGATRWRMLDVGAGYGRDVLRFAEEPDIEPVALENAGGFVRYLRRAQDEGRIGPDGVMVTDMRDLSVIEDGRFHCIRVHATLHHLPLVSHGLGADAAVAGFRRVLAPGGVLYVLVKSGTGVNVIDTGEGLGGRFFQLFTSASLRQLLERHSFSVVQMEEAVEPRSSGNVDWLFALAVAE
ncbi:class I SAM-dependent methyltransferase [Streptomyces sp. WMMC940]|uniref:class I SAM-dependent methyltransferase n=1 Tax=Streptomyces sp. WMMC940 TaxID=3015153 RepID=UPI0022B74E67|nr:class I SAM-dependent methyltransferase [Streptomyces sp. WMMC940]MCZ7458627.1 class I SAM-dependent methyltransferase [Streptomyces sp. WMMC940]